MSKTVVLGLDGSADSVRAIPYATELAGDGGRIIVVHVREILLGRAGGQPVAVNEDEIEAEVRRQAEDIGAAGPSTEVKVATSTAGNPAHVLADIARDHDADLIVVGTRGHSQIAGLILGSVTNRLLHITPCPVLAVPPAPAGKDAEKAEAAAVAANA
jgi:nucleotide-binding universal stress UspA family protein